MAATSAPGAPRFSPVERPRAAIATDGTLAAIVETTRIVVLELPRGEPFAEVGVDAEAIANEVAWVGGPPRLLVLSRYADHTLVHLIDPHGPRAIADVRFESAMRLAATVGAHALVVGPHAAMVLTASESALATSPYPARTLPATAGAAGTNLLVALADSIEEWDPQTRMPKRRLKLPRPVAIQLLGGSDRVVWMTTQQEPARLDVLALVDRGQPKAHDLPELIAHASGHPRSDLVVCVGESGKVYVVDLDGRARLKTLAIDGIDRVEAAGLVVGRVVGVLAAQARHPVAIVTLDGQTPEPEAEPAAERKKPPPPPGRSASATTPPPPPRTATPSSAEPPPIETRIPTRAQSEGIEVDLDGVFEEPVRDAKEAEVWSRLREQADARDAKAGMVSVQDAIEALGGTAEPSPPPVTKAPAEKRKRTEPAKPPEPTARAAAPPAKTATALATKRAPVADAPAAVSATTATVAEIPVEPAKAAATAPVADAPAERAPATPPPPVADGPERAAAATRSEASPPVEPAEPAGGTAGPRSATVVDEPPVEAARVEPPVAARESASQLSRPRSDVRDLPSRPAPLPPKKEPTIREAPPLPSVKPAWRDEVVYWTYDVFDGVVERGAPVPTPIDELGARFGLPLPLLPAIVLLYGAHLAGERGVAPVHVARVTGKWDEALGRGVLAQLGLASYGDSRVRLGGPIQRVLDELPVETGALVGIAGQRGLAGPHVVVARPDIPLKVVAVKCLAQAGGAILAAFETSDLAELFVEARARGAAPMFRIAADDLLELGTDPAILVAADDEVADSLGVPRLG